MKSLTELYSKLPTKIMLTGTTALAGVFYAPVAMAQVSAPDTVVEAADPDEIVVTGIRQALKEARDLKRAADTAVDSITASDVSTLPDLSVAEALSRVPGVVSQRFDLTDQNNGDFPSSEGGNNIVRGLSLVRSEFNGRDAFTANGGRALDFGTIPPELIGSVNVYKNVTADLIEGGIAGTIDLRTLEPFDNPGTIATLTLDGTYTDLAEEVTPEGTVTLGTRWDGTKGEFGLLGSFAHSELETRTDNFQIGQLVPFEVDGVSVAIPGGFQARTNDRDRERQSYYAAGQWQNNADTFKATLKYSRVENDVTNDERTLESFVNGESAGAIQLPEGITTTPFQAAGLALCNSQGGIGLACEETRDVTALFESGLISNGNRDWTGSRGAETTALGIHIDERSSTEDISLNVEWRPADQWFVNLDIHKTNADFERDRLWSVTNFFADYNLNADLDDLEVSLVLDPENAPFRDLADGTRTTDVFANPSLTNPAAQFQWAAADQFERNEGDVTAFRADVEYEFGDDGWFDSVQIGGRYSERDQTNRNTNLNWAQIAPPWAGRANVSIDQVGFGVEEFDYSDFLRGGAVTGDTTILFTDRDTLSDYNAFITALAADRAAGVVNEDGFQPLADLNGNIDFTRDIAQLSTVSEETVALYARLNFGNEFNNGMRLSGNVGLRYTDTDTSGVGDLVFNPIEIDIPDPNDPNDIRVDITQFIPDTVAFSNSPNEDRSGEFASDDFFLPSFNAKLDLNDTSLIRLGVSKNITRPNISQLNPSQIININPTRVADDITNRTVDAFPTRISVSGGNPDLVPIESWNYDLSFEHYYGDENFLSAAFFYKDISNNIIRGSNIIDTVSLDGLDVPVIFDGEVNDGDGEIAGVELAVQHFFTEAPGIFSNFGVQANYTYIDAERTPDDAFTDADGDGNVDGGTDPLSLFRFGVEDYLGLSEHAVNAIGIYQDDELEFRLAYNWRSDFVSSYSDFITGNPIFQEEAGFLDASAKYNVNDNLQFRFQVSNILATSQDATQQINADGDRFSRASIQFDRRFRLGLRYNF